MRVYSVSITEEVTTTWDIGSDSEEEAVATGEYLSRLSVPPVPADRSTRVTKINALAKGTDKEEEHR